MTSARSEGDEEMYYRMIKIDIKEKYIDFYSEEVVYVGASIQRACAIHDDGYHVAMIDRISKEVKYA